MLPNTPSYYVGIFLLLNRALAEFLPPTIPIPAVVENDGLIQFSDPATGGVSFSLPQLLGNDLSPYLSQIACQVDQGPDPFIKRRQTTQSYPCAVQNAKIAMKAVPLNSKAWHSLVLTPPLFPILKSGLQNAINQVYSYSATLPQWTPGYVNDTQLHNISAIMFVLATNHEFDTPGQSILLNTIPYSDLAIATLPPESMTSPPASIVPSSTRTSAMTSGTGRCPSVTFTTPTATVVAPPCDAPGCLGDGKFCMSPPLLGCECLDIEDVDDGDSIVSPQEWDAAQAYLASVNAYDEPLSVMSTPSPTPSSVTPTPTVSPTPALSSCASSQNWPYNMAATAALSAATSYCTSIVSLLPQMPNGPGSCAVPNLSPPYNPPGNSDICADQGDITFSAGLDTSVEACKSYPFTFSSSDCTTALTSVINDCDSGQAWNKHGGRMSIHCMVYSIFPFPVGNNGACRYLGLPYFGCNYGWMQQGKSCSMSNCLRDPGSTF